MPKKSVTVGTTVFASVGEAEVFIRTNVIAAHDGAPRIPIGPIHDFVEDLLNLHEDAVAKIGVGVDYFRVDPAHIWKVGFPVNRSYRTLVIVRTDGNEEDWSWTGIISKPTAITQVRTAMRNAAYDAIQKMKRDAVAAGPVSCARTGVAVTSPNDLQVRHRSISFANLTADFASSVGGWTSIATTSTGAGAEMSDPAIKSAWTAYFVANAVPSFELKY